MTTTAPIHPPAADPPALDPARTAAEAPGSVRWVRRGDLTEITTATYSVLINHAGFPLAPYAILRDANGRVWSALNLLSSVHTSSAPDEVFEVETCDVRRVDAERVEVVVVTRSTAWTSHELTLSCGAEALELSVCVQGDGLLAEVLLLGGHATLSDGSSGLFASSIDFASVLVPAPGEPVQLVRPSHSAGQLGVVGDADPGRLHAVFSPPPLVFGFGRELPTGPTSVPAGRWLGLSLRAPVSALTFTTMTYAPLDGGFVVALAYEGHTEVEGEWTSPVLVLRPADHGWDVLSDYRRDLVQHGCAPAGGPTPTSWWQQPLFCGWGAQCALAASQGRGLAGAATAVHASAAPGSSPRVEGQHHLVVGAAAGFARQDVYDGFLSRLAEHHLDPGTVVIDDRWQARYGTAEPDLQRWPDLGGWIADRHREGRRVLLWWKAWDPDGLPVDECTLDAGGRPVAADPANPRYLERLTAVVTQLISAGGLDADGLKIDFTQRAPSGSSLRGSPGVWGIAALHALLQTIYRAAKAAKPDALVICHTVHPAFGDVCDMVRLNDVSKNDVTASAVPVVDQVRFRHAIAGRTLPDHLQDTDQWPMPNRAEWLRYVQVQPELGVPALYYLDSIDRSGELIGSEDLAAVASSWHRYRQGLER